MMMEDRRREMRQKYVSKTEIKEYCQEELVSAMGLAFQRLADEDWPEPVKEQYRAVMSEQMARVEKLFGIEPYSFMRGC
jgi:hypothetical protein